MMSRITRKSPTTERHTRHSRQCRKGLRVPFVIGASAAFVGGGEVWVSAFGPAHSIFGRNMPMRVGSSEGGVSFVRTAATRQSHVRMLQPERNEHSSPVGLMERDVGNEGGAKLDDLLSSNNLREAASFIRGHPLFQLTKKQFVDVFRAIEERTSDKEENEAILELVSEAARFQDIYPPSSPSRTEMVRMYTALQETGRLKLFGAVAGSQDYPAQGDKTITPTVLEEATEMNMEALTPAKSSNNLLIAGAFAAVLEGVISAVTGVDFNALVFSTLFAAFLDRLVVSGAVFETIVRIITPDYSNRILRHEAGHFLIAYLLGCPVEGCVLSTWAALKDSRFSSGPGGAVSAGTSFFDMELSDQINGRKPLTREVLDRYSVIVMAGIAAEALNFGRADGGAGDEAALVTMLATSTPRGGGAKMWTAEGIRSQARWAAVQAILMLRQYQPCYDALVDALERGGSLGECVYAIEEAGRKANLRPHLPPIGTVVSDGTEGKWEKWGAASNAPVAALSDTSVEPLMTSTAAFEEMESTPEETLAQYRRLAEEKLKKIEDDLKELSGEKKQ